MRVSVSAQSNWEVAQSSYDVVMSKYCDVLCINALLFVSDVR